jgi:hypothetical protein
MAAACFCIIHRAIPFNALLYNFTPLDIVGLIQYSCHPLTQCHNHQELSLFLTNIPRLRYDQATLVGVWTAKCLDHDEREINRNSRKGNLPSQTPELPQRSPPLVMPDRQLKSAPKNPLTAPPQ